MTEPRPAIAVITGSTRGIGRAIAEALVRRGDQVVVSGRKAKDAEKVAKELAGIGPGQARGIGCDVRKPIQCQKLIAGAVELFGGIDVLVNNAGIGRFAKIHEMKVQDWDVQIRTNLDGVFHCSKAVVPHLIERGGGWIVNIGSLAGRNAFSGGAAYNATKWGLLGMSEAMMLDLRHLGIRVTCIMPGSVNTDFSSGRPDPTANWKLTANDVAQAVMGVLAFPSHALPSKIEIRPSRPPKDG